MYPNTIKQTFDCSTAVRKFRAAVRACAIAFLAALVFSPSTALAFGVGLQPSTVEMTIKPGETQRQVITIGNVHKEKTITLTLGLADWDLDEDGNLILMPPGETDRSAAIWARFTPATVTLKPEQSKEIVVEIMAPFKVKAKGDHRFALLASTLLPEQSKRGEVSGVWNKYQIATLFYMTFNPAQSTPKITTVEHKTDDTSDFIIMNIENDGDAHARLLGTAVIRNASGTEVAETPLSTVVLDSSTRRYAVKLPDDITLGTGTYDVEFNLKNHFAPQNDFKADPVEVTNLQIVK